MHRHAQIGRLVTLHGRDMLGKKKVKRLRQMELENARLKKLLAERDLEIEVMKEIAAKKW